MSSPRGADPAAAPVEVEADASPGPVPPPSAARRLSLRALPVLWPAFVMAGVLEALVFAVIDPAALHVPGSRLSGLSSSAVYSLTFGVFWAAVAAAGALTQWLESPAAGPAR